METKSHLDLTQVFCDVDDFSQNFERCCHSTPQLTAWVGEQLCRSHLLAIAQYKAVSSIFRNWTTRWHY